jgi:hypothetical protein
MVGQRDIGRSWNHKSEPEVADQYRNLGYLDEFPRLNPKKAIFGSLEPTKIPETILLAKRAVITD